MVFDDIDQVLVIEHASFGTPWPRSAFEDELTVNMLADYVVAAGGPQVVGYCGVWHVVDEGHITNLAVHPEWRGQGIGRMLMTAMMDWAEEHRVDGMTLEVRAGNLVAQALYASFGFAFAGVRKAYYSDNGEDAWVLWWRRDPNDGVKLDVNI